MNASAEDLIDRLNVIQRIQAPRARAALIESELGAVIDALQSQASGTPLLVSIPEDKIWDILYDFASEIVAAWKLNDERAMGVAMAKAVKALRGGK